MGAGGIPEASDVALRRGCNAKRQYELGLFHRKCLHLLFREAMESNEDFILTVRTKGVPCFSQMSHTYILHFKLLLKLFLCPLSTHIGPQGGGHENIELKHQYNNI